MWYIYLKYPKFVFIIYVNLICTSFIRVYITKRIQVFLSKKRNVCNRLKFEYDLKKKKFPSSHKKNHCQ